MSIFTNYIGLGDTPSGDKLQENFLDLKRYINGGLEGVTSDGVHSYAHAFQAASGTPQYIRVPARPVLTGFGIYVGGTGTLTATAAWYSVLADAVTSTELTAAAGTLAWVDLDESISLLNTPYVEIDTGSAPAATDVTYILRFGGAFDPASRP